MTARHELPPAAPEERAPPDGLDLVQAFAEARPPRFSDAILRRHDPAPALASEGSIVATYPDDDDDDNEDGGPPIDRPGLRLLIEHATAARFFDLPPTALPRPNMSPSLRMSASAILRSFREEPSKSQAVANAQAAPEEKDTTK